MLSPADFIPLTYSEDLTRVGVEYACHSLVYAEKDAGGSWYARLRKIVADTSVELAFRRYLISQKIPHEIIRTTPFTEPEHYDVSLGRRRCVLISSLISHRETIRRLRINPKTFLESSAMVPDEMVLLDQFADTDILLFAFALALTTGSKEELMKAINAHQPIFLLHKLPEKWNLPGKWDTFGELTLKAESKKAVSIHLGGLGVNRELLGEEITLHPGQRIKAKNNYYSLVYMSTEQLPEGKIFIHSRGLNRSHKIETHHWRNIWLYGMAITLPGYITFGEFRQQASPLSAGSQTLSFTRTKQDNLALPVEVLHPLEELFSSTKKWAKK